MFFNILQILETKKPSAFFLENVRHIKNHDEGRTMQTIERSIKSLGYSFQNFIVCASDHGLPQFRPRCFIIGFADGREISPPKKRKLKKTMSDILGGHCDREIGFTLRVSGRRSPIDGRHNWDGYVVDGVPRRLSVREAATMQKTSDLQFGFCILTFNPRHDFASCFFVEDVCQFIQPHALAARCRHRYSAHW